MTTRKDYAIYADDILRPDCFVYALDNNKFSLKEIGKIPFEYGENVESFSQKYRKEDLLSKIRKEILSPKKRPKIGDCDCDFHFFS